MKAFIVGDVHGNWDLVTGLLKKAGIPKRSQREGFSVIQVGDLANCVAQDIDSDLRCLVEAPEWFDVVLVGNHEHPYLGGPRFAGFAHDTRVEEIILQLEETEVMQPSFLADDILITHAGCTPHWNYESAEQAHRRIQSVWAVDKTASLFSDIGRSRGGMTKFGGILWSDWLREPKTAKFRQIVGHTPILNGPRSMVALPKGNWKHTVGVPRNWDSVNIDIDGKKYGQIAGVWVEDGAITETVVYREAEDHP